MRFIEAKKRVMNQFNQFLLGNSSKEKCEDGKHCAFAEGVNLEANPGFATPINVGIANTEGNLETLVRSDHVHNHPAGLGFALHHTHYLYEIPGIAASIFGYSSQGAATLVASGRVRLTTIVVPFQLTISGLVAFHGAVAGGNFRMAIYGPDTATPPVADGNPLIDETASTACNGINRAQHVALSGGNLQLDPGLYWIGIQADNNTDTYSWLARATWHVAGDHFDFSRYFANPGGYGAFDDPIPATTATTYIMEILLRVTSIP